MDESKRHWDRLRMLSREWNFYSEAVHEASKKIRKREDKRVLMRSRVNGGVEGFFYHNGHGLALRTKDRDYNLGDMAHSARLFLGKPIFGLTCFSQGEIREMAGYLEASLED